MKRPRTFLGLLSLSLSLLLLHPLPRFLHGSLGRKNLYRLVFLLNMEISQPGYTLLDKIEKFFLRVFPRMKASRASPRQNKWITYLEQTNRKRKGKYRVSRVDRVHALIILLRFWKLVMKEIFFFLRVNDCLNYFQNL